VRGDLEGYKQTENWINLSFKTTLKRKAQLPFSKHGAFFDQFPALPLTLLFIGSQPYSIVNFCSVNFRFLVDQ
jgi:hypothetical protein